MEYDKIDLIDARVEKLLQRYTRDQDIGLYTNALYLLILIFCIALSLLYVLDGYKQLVFSFGLASLVIYRYIISKSANTVSALSNYNGLESNSKLDLTIYKLNYLSALIKHKITRISALRFFYIICFPLWLVMLAKLVFFRTTSLQEIIVLLISAYLISSPYWFFFFKKSIDNLQMQLTDVNEVMVDLA